jgi:hypothetical protein
VLSDDAFELKSVVFKQRTRHMFTVRAAPLYEVEVNLQQSVMVSVQILVFCLRIAGFLMWGTLSDERMGLYLHNCFWALPEQ